MNDFRSRVMSLLLGVAFLVGAGYLGFQVIFNGTAVYATTDLDKTEIIAVEGRSNGKLTTTRAQQITIRFTFTGTTDPDLSKEWKIKFDNSDILKILNDGKITDLEKETNDPKIITGKLNVKLDRNRDEFITGELYIDAVLISKAVVIDIAGWLPSNDSGPSTYNLQSYHFNDSSGDRITKLTRNKKIDELVVTIKEGGIDKTTYDNSHKSDFQASLNYEVFEPRDRDRSPEFSKTATPLPGGSISYTVTFRDLKYTGESKQLIVKIGYPQHFGLERREFTETLPEGELHESSSSSSSESSSSSVEADPPTPRIIITEYDFGMESVPAASDATLSLTFKNMSKRVPVDNIVLKVTMPEGLTLTNSSNTFYFERLGREREETILIPFSVKPKAEAISHAIKLSFSFEPVISDKRTPLTSEEEIAIPVVQLNRMMLNPVESPPEIYIGDNSNTIEATFVNKGKTAAHNVTISIEGTNIKQVPQSQFFGNMESGIEKSADFTLEAVEPGEVKGEVVLTYEDDSMKVSELRVPFSTTAQDMAGGDMPELPPEPPAEPVISVAWHEGIPAWYWIVGGLMGIVMLLYLVKLAKVSRLTLQEEEDADL